MAEREGPFPRWLLHLRLDVGASCWPEPGLGLSSGLHNVVFPWVLASSQHGGFWVVGGWAAYRVVQSSQSENNSHEPGRGCSNFYDQPQVTGLLLPFSIHQSGRTSARVRGGRGRSRLGGAC